MHVVIVGQGLDGVGGVPTVTRWLAGHLEGSGVSYEVINLATSMRDPFSRRLLAPNTWFRSSLVAAADATSHASIGANLVEWEVARYLPRADLSARLAHADIIQVIAGGPALANACLSSGKPVVIQVATIAAWERGTHVRGLRGLWDRLNHPVIEFLERRALRGASAVLVENQQMAGYVRALGQHRVVLAPPGVDCDFFSPGSDWQARGPLVSVCRLGDRRKGLDRMVRAYALLTCSYPQAPNLLLAGAGPLPSALRSAITDLGLSDRVAIREDVEQLELRDLYRTGSVFLQTSHEEGLGLSSLEAMASGLPVVASRTAGSSAVVDSGVTGVLVDEGPDFEARFAQAIQSVLESSGAAMSPAARQRAVGFFSDEATFARYRDVYEEIA